MQLLLLLGALAMTGAPYSFTIDTTQAPPATDYNIGGYDAVESHGKRKANPTRLVREDTLLRTGRRQRLIGGSNDLARNFSIAGWMVRRHLDYVARFDFHSRNATCGKCGHVNDKDRLRDLDDTIERLMREDSTRRRMDFGARLSREKMFRFAELRRTLDGDVGLALLRTGRVQGIESDLIRQPDGTELASEPLARNRYDWVDGVRRGLGGVHLNYAIHRRGSLGNGYELSRVIQARNMVMYGHYTRFASDQVRGVSPIVQAINPLRDVYEGFDYALAKLKVSQLLALAFFRDGESDVDPDDEDNEASDTEYNPDFSGGPIKLDLEPGDRAEFLESRTPSTEMQAFTSLIIAVSLKALDIPYSFYDESHTNFFGSRGAWLHYERSCLDKRDDQIEMRDQYTRWKLRGWILSGRLVLPAGVTIADLHYEWVPRGMPWWDPSKEIKGDLLAIGGGLDNPERVVKRTGNGDVYDNLRAMARVLKFAEDHGREVLGRPLPISFSPNGVAAASESRPAPNPNEDDGTPNDESEESETEGDDES